MVLSKKNLDPLSIETILVTDENDRKLKRNKGVLKNKPKKRKKERDRRVGGNKITPRRSPSSSSSSPLLSTAPDNIKKKNIRKKHSSAKTNKNNPFSKLTRQQKISLISVILAAGLKIAVAMLLSLL